MYSHRWFNEQEAELPTGKAVCIGRNYVEHAKELNNPIPDEPVLFIKPATSIVGTDSELALSERLAPIHYEAELSVLISKPLTKATPEDVLEAIAGVGVALDLTRREAQSKLKEKGLPWELAKAFDGSCVQSPFVPFEGFNLSATTYGLDINGRPTQCGDTSLMINPVVDLICHITQYFTLAPGDIVLTGTPKGVGKLADGDALTLTLADEVLAEFSCISAP
ncbi:fumarylacetoacetate hydrolase family protein [Grimontia kaedaensis]|uniref:Fumarylacetoacetate hydrolase family protein n=1 Tax=Grimontia kaedaensis TaxID=2872157 RepID=A0ABY4X119_9GAMM|nr:fumarylacetoacetate hydrolase family protein [Grimontia kaedaensis]USH04915.1 fumarylacetoacetate hydrolase family protein [Grimontia kaedaensis]